MSIFFATNQVIAKLSWYALNLVAVDGLMHGHRLPFCRCRAVQTRMLILVGHGSLDQQKPAWTSKRWTDHPPARPRHAHMHMMWCTTIATSITGIGNQTVGAITGVGTTGCLNRDWQLLDQGMTTIHSISRWHRIEAVASALDWTVVITCVILFFSLFLLSTNTSWLLGPCLGYLGHGIS